MSKAQFLREYKLVVVGGGAVGKSALTIQFVQNTFESEWNPTIEDSYRKQCLIDNELVCLDVLDTAGQEEYKAMREQYMRHGEGFILVYSITDLESFREVLEFQQQIARVKDMDFYPAVLVGNKSDLEYERQVSPSEGRDLAQRFGFSFLETSARLRINVDETFVEIVREIKRHNKVRQEQNTGGKPSRKGSLMGSPHHVPMMDTQTEGGHHDGCCSRCVLA